MADANDPGYNRERIDAPTQETLVNSNGTGGLGDATRIIGRVGPVIVILAILSILAVALLSKLGCANHHTPAGHEGYIRSKPLVGAGEYVGLQKGPISTGWVWRQHVINIDMRPRTYSEEMKIRTAKGSDLKFKAHVRVKLRDGGVRDIVEKLGGAEWYEANVKKTFQRAVRDEVQVLDAFEVKNNMLKISRLVLETMEKEYKGRPIEFLSVDIGNIKYPETIMNSVIKKFVTYQENERKEIELDIAEKQIDIAVAEATGTADAQRVIGKTLDPLLLQYEALRAIDQLSGSKNTTFLLMPQGNGQGSPVILDLGVNNGQSAAPAPAPAKKKGQRVPKRRGKGK